MTDNGKLYTDENGNRLKIDTAKKYIEQTVHFVDENGNKLKFDLQSQQWATGEPGIDSGGDFNGYTVYPVNNDPDIDVHDDASAKAWDAAYDKIYKNAEQYFEKHPEQCPADGYSRKNSYTTAYVKILAGEEMKRRVASGKASSLEKAYVHQINNMKSTQCFSWEQLLGDMPLDAPAEEVAAMISCDELSATMRRQAEEYKLSVERGTESIRNRVAEAQSLRYDIRSKNREVPGADEALRKQRARDKTLSPDEANAVIHNHLQKKIR